MRCRQTTSTTPMPMALQAAQSPRGRPTTWVADEIPPRDGTLRPTIQISGTCAELQRAYATVHVVIWHPLAVSGLSANGRYWSARSKEQNRGAPTAGRALAIRTSACIQRAAAAERYLFARVRTPPWTGISICARRLSCENARRDSEVHAARSLLPYASIARP